MGDLSGKLIAIELRIFFSICENLHCLFEASFCVIFIKHKQGKHKIHQNSMELLIYFLICHPSLSPSLLSPSFPPPRTQRHTRAHTHTMKMTFIYFTAACTPQLFMGFYDSNVIYFYMLSSKISWVLLCARHYEQHQVQKMNDL